MLKSEGKGHHSERENTDFTCNAGTPAHTHIQDLSQSPSAQSMKEVILLDATPPSATIVQDWAEGDIVAIASCYQPGVGHHQWREAALSSPPGCACEEIGWKRKLQTLC